MLLCGNNLSFSYDCKKILFKDINIQIESSERVCLYGRSGYGKSTLGKILSGYEKSPTGQVLLDNKPIDNKGFSPVQLIYQHPEKSVNPRWTVKQILTEGGQDSLNLLEKIGLTKDYLTRYPYELSGGELQRISIARAINKNTKFIIADEITTMLDPITQANIWSFLLEETKERNIGLLIITHNKHLGEMIATRYIDFERL